MTVIPAEYVVTKLGGLPIPDNAVFVVLRIDHEESDMDNLDTLTLKAAARVGAGYYGTGLDEVDPKQAKRVIEAVTVATIQYLTARGLDGEAAFGAILVEAISRKLDKRVKEHDKPVPGGL